MNTELIEAARLAGVKKFIGLGTICSYPSGAKLPLEEKDLWNGYPEEPTALHGITRRILLSQLQAYRTQYDFNGIFLMPVNLYGPGDHLDPQSIRLVPALIQKVLSAKSGGHTYIELSGNSNNTLDMLFVEDAAEGLILAAELYDQEFPINLGSGQEVTLGEITENICGILGFSGEVRWADKSTMISRRVVDTSRAEKYFGFKAHTSLRDGLSATINWYLKEQVR